MDKPRLKSSQLLSINLFGLGDKRELNNLKADLMTINVANTTIKNNIGIKLIIFLFFFHSKFQLLVFEEVLSILEHSF